MSLTTVELRDISNEHSTSSIESLQNLVYLAKGWARAATEAFQRRNAIIRQKYAVTKRDADLKNENVNTA